MTTPNSSAARGNSLLKWSLRLIGPALLVYFIWSVVRSGQIGAFVDGLVNIALLPFIVSLALFPAFVAVKVWRWQLLLGKLGLPVPSFGYLMAVYSIGLFLGNTTPGQSGDFIKALYIPHQQKSLAPVLFSILLDRLFDFMIMAPLAFGTFIVLPDVLPQEVRPLAIVFMVLFFVSPIVLISSTLRSWLFGLAIRLAPGKLKQALARWQEQMAQLDLSAALFARLSLASVLSAVVTMLRVYLLFVALDLTNIPVAVVVTSTALIALLQTLPISFAGLGVREFVLGAILTSYGYSNAIALSLSVLFLIINIEHVIIGFLVSLRYPIKAQPS